MILSNIKAYLEHKGAYLEHDQASMIELFCKNS